MDGGGGGGGGGDQAEAAGVRRGPGRWTGVLLSALGSVLILCAAGVLCSLIYPILRELKTERVRAADGTEVPVLGFYSVLAVSVVAGCVCSSLSWTLTYLDSYQPGMAPPSLLALAKHGRGPGQSFHVGYGVALLNGVMATLAVIWSLT